MGAPLHVLYLGAEEPPPSLAKDGSLTVTAVSETSDGLARLDADRFHCVVTAGDFETVRAAVRDRTGRLPVIFEASDQQRPPLDRGSGPVDIGQGELLAHRVGTYADEFRRRRRIAAERDRDGEIVEAMPVGLLVVDSELTIRRVNDEVDSLFGDIEGLRKGTAVETLFEEVDQSAAGTTDPAERIRTLLAEAADTADEGGRVSDHLWIETESGRSCYELSVSARDREPRYIVLVRDVTATKRREEQLREREDELERRTTDLETQTAKLEYQNERLDKFAAIVSHDLRNPLNVASGRLSLLAETVEEADDPAVDPDGIEQIRRAHERMSDIIDEALTLAREGKAITETERTHLTETARRAWSNVETGDASLDLCGPVEIESDPERLQTVFENLFRNAVEHGTDDGTEELTASVGLLEDGFYVEDTGPGIPEENREQVFEEGFTTDSGGTGFGLAIVRDVVRAHGWEITATAGSAGGARFEVTGVSFALTTGDLIDRLAEPLGNKKATELVDAALTELGIDQTRLDYETGREILETIADRDGENGLVTVAAETASRKLDC